jgi:hypothetical protein
MKKLKLLVLLLIFSNRILSQDSVFYYSNMYTLDTTVSAEYFEIDITISEHYNYIREKRKSNLYIYTLDSIYPKMEEILLSFVKKEDISLINSVNNSNQKTSVYLSHMNLNDYTYRIYLDNEQQVLDLLKKLKFKGLKGVSGKGIISKESESKMIELLQNKIRQSGYRDAENLYGDNPKNEISLINQSYSENIFQKAEIISEFKIDYNVTLSRKGYLNFTIKRQKN